ncbi:RNA polymerase subunit sigma [Pedobacter ginsengisoli]|uniref:RNA polymerase subunit sigma n=1 Tax=Pedobacter ginsengisoli TaxID=363852 RepID=A0A2D1U7B1_9SPHI|nr:RNA polymerase sigma factor RpoD/SigA [Pedobacter ginsengisoli]ATP57444.1 RNA polymerase subunit sigma [Pedobacter ginsengisoli]
MRDIRIEQAFMKRDEVSLNRYLSEVSRIQLLKPEEEGQLAKRIKEGDEAAVQKLVSANLRFVISVAKKYQGQGLPLSDLINEGNIGLLNAARRFDETKGFKFISYAVWWIRQAIMMAMSEQIRIIRVPMNQILAVQKIRSCQLALAQDLEREPSLAEIAELSEIKEIAVLNHLGWNFITKSLDEKLNEDSEQEFSAYLEDPNATASDEEMIRLSMQADIDHLLGVLTKREKIIIKGLYGLGGQRLMSIEEVAEQNDISRERVRQIKAASIVKLKKYAPKRLTEHFQK